MTQFTFCPTALFSPSAPFCPSAPFSALAPVSPLALRPSAPGPAARSRWDAGPPAAHRRAAG